MKDNHKKYIERTFYLANKGLGNVSPNPMVGCVIVKSGKIIGEGYHEKYGKEHAEINAINNVTDKSLLEGSSFYINLEPCSHHGKTPPCSDEIMRYKPKEVIISNQDQNPIVNGKGINKLKKGGISVIENIEKEKGLIVNKRFFKNQLTNLPYIILKWAETKDGFIAKEDGSSKWISNELSRMLVHKWRSEEPGILIGVNTANTDNPSLNVRSWTGNDPTRIVLDPNFKINEKIKLFEDEGALFVYNKEFDKKLKNKHLIQNKSFILKDILRDILEKGIGSIIVEGGAKTINSFIEEGLWDEARVFVSDKKFEKGIKAPKIDLKKYQKIRDNKLYTIYNHA
jgi:diaminohydroxyphosphoribosylaminopyrimidine deaminase/5-amino-6-(5-phosphoribosylamino)uracil reductase